MIVYLNEANLPLAGVPKHLIGRRFDEFCNALYDSWGVRLLDGNEHGIIRIDITGASPEGVFSALDFCGAVCVDLEPGDLATLAGKSPETLYAADLMQVDPAVRNGCQRLTIDEVMSTVGQLISLALRTSQEAADMDAAALAQAPEEIRPLLEYDRAKAEQAGIQRMKQFGIEMPADESHFLDKPWSEFPDLTPDESANDAAFGIGVQRGVASPWSFNE